MALCGKLQKPAGDSSSVSPGSTQLFVHLADEKTLISPGHSRNLRQDPVCGLQLRLQHPSSRLCCRKSSPSCTWPVSTCRWITDFLSDRKQHVRLGKHLSDSWTISIGSPQGCVLSPLLFSLYTDSCTSSHQSVKLLKFQTTTTLIGLISGGDESAYRWEMDHLVTWCGENHLELNALKVTAVESFPSWALSSPRTLKRKQNICSLTTKSTAEDTPITIWYAAATAKDRAGCSVSSALQRR
ncbi:uncharacterized protein LOC117536622 [Gymnodraco acuticeps]|uniref:Uncharacterized protein LOC117536622 n=1 Tax=Gymnodraco acuticeps TaxID=8218 RepID=A0A6P8T1U4_GYMAC|nr:uncharacterized protein LOC117536622 [Gymnodraco acuticeps]